jgi:hypothetical protein
MRSNLDVLPIVAGQEMWAQSVPIRKANASDDNGFYYWKPVCPHGLFSTEVSNVKKVTSACGGLAEKVVQTIGVRQNALCAYTERLK